MSDTPAERNSNSKSNLIEVQHVGVTAKVHSPLKNLMQSYGSSTETDNEEILHRSSSHHHSNAKYNKFMNEAPNETDTTVTDNSKILYEMKSIHCKRGNNKSFNKLTPSKIEFQLHTKQSKRLQKNKCNNCTPKKKNSKRKLFECETKSKANCAFKEPCSIFQRLTHSLDKMKALSGQQQPSADKIFADLPEPEVCAQNSNSSNDVRIGIYPFDHGCAEYLKTHDCPPQIVSLVLAERATHYATRFWAEFFGSIYIGVAFIVTFMLQSYRFVLYSLVNTLLVGFLHMTSDYLLKPLLTVIFNGFLQPPLIFCFNILSSIRDMLEPIADTINSFMKPVATVGRSLRLVHATYNKKNITKNV